MEQLKQKPHFAFSRVLFYVRHPQRPFLERLPRPARKPRSTRGWRSSRVVKLFAVLSIFGPGLIAANAGNDAGGIATYASVGAQYGYSLLWMMVLITFSMAVIQEMCARMGAATGKGLSDLIRERFGVRGSLFAMLTLLDENNPICALAWSTLRP